MAIELGPLVLESFKDLKILLILNTNFKKSESKIRYA